MWVCWEAFLLYGLNVYERVHSTRHTNAKKRACEPVSLQRHSGLHISYVRSLRTDLIRADQLFSYRPRKSGLRSQQVGGLRLHGTWWRKTHAQPQPWHLLNAKPIHTSSLKRRGKKKGLTMGQVAARTPNFRRSGQTEKARDAKSCLTGLETGYDDAAVDFLDACTLSSYAQAHQQHKPAEIVPRFRLSSSPRTPGGPFGVYVRSLDGALVYSFGRS